MGIVAVQASTATERAPGFGSGSAGLGMWYPRLTTRNWRVMHELYNPANTDITVVAYYCQARRDLPFSGGNMCSPLEVYGRGLASQGLQGATPTSSNAYLLDANVTPFMSTNFCELYKVIKTKRFQLGGGHRRKLYLSHKKPMHWNMARFQYGTTGQTPATYGLTVGMRQWSKFLLISLIPPICPTTGAATNMQAPLKIVWSHHTSVEWCAPLEQRPTTAIAAQPASYALVENTAGTLASIREMYDEDYKTATVT